MADRYAPTGMITTSLFFRAFGWELISDYLEVFGLGRQKQKLERWYGKAK